MNKAGYDSSIVIIAGSESYAFDIGRVASGLANAFLVRYAPLGEFNGSTFELHQFSGPKRTKIADLKVPLSTRGRVRWMTSRVPLFFVNTVAMAALAIRATRLSKSDRTRTVGVGIGWGGALICLLMKSLRLVGRIAYYRVDWFVPIQDNVYSSMSVGFFRNLDRLLSSQSDYVWNLTQAIGNKSLVAPRTKDECQPVIIPPIRARWVPANAGTSQTHSPYFVYFGEVKQGCGLPLILQAIDILRRSGTRTELRIIGRARPEYIEGLFGRFPDLFGEGYCKYLGPVNVGDSGEQEKLNAVIRSACAGLAVTPGGLSNTSNFALQNRVMIYITNCVPTIINDDSAVAKWISSRGLGMSVKPIPESIAGNLESLLGSEDLVKSLKSNIGDFLAKGESEDIMREAIVALLNGTGVSNISSLVTKFEAPSWSAPGIGIASPTKSSS